MVGHPGKRKFFFQALEAFKDPGARPVQNSYMRSLNNNKHSYLLEIAL